MRKHWAKRSYCLCWKMSWTTTREQHCSLKVVRSFLEKHGRKKSTAQAHVASTAPLLHPQSQNLPRQTTQRQQRQFKKEKKKKRSNLFRVLPTRNWTVRGQDRSWMAVQLQIASLVTTGNALRVKSLLCNKTPSPPARANSVLHIIFFYPFISI